MAEPQLKIGIDVGGTNTDAVLLDEHNRLVAAHKTATTPDVQSGIEAGLRRLLEDSGVERSTITAAMLGTTACTNAIIERKRLVHVGLLRLSAPAGYAVEPYFTWPDDLRAAVGDRWAIVRGGYEFDGREIAPLDEEEVRRVVRDMAAAGVRSVAIAGIYAAVRPQQELRAAAIVREVLGNVPVSLSHEVGTLGFLERENSTALNAALVDVVRVAADGFEHALRNLGVKARIHFAQNDGTLMALEYAKRYPVFTIGSGPTNSIRGAAFLSGRTDCVVVDIGGTSTDVGVLVKGFPRESAIAVEIGQVRTNFRMPDIYSIGLGGGSIVCVTAAELSVGPSSVGHRLTSDALSWGGSVLTATDIVLASGRVSLDARAPALERGFVERAQDHITKKVEDAIDRMKTRVDPVPVVLVGGGSILVGDRLKGASEVVRPLNGQYGNAIGAAIAQVSGEVDKMWDLSRLTRDQAIAEAQHLAVERAVVAGARRDTVQIVDVEEVPLAYLPSNALRIRVKAAGDVGVFA